MRSDSWVYAIEPCALGAGAPAGRGPGTPGSACSTIATSCGWNRGSAPRAPCAASSVATAARSRVLKEPVDRGRPRARLGQRHRRVLGAEGDAELERQEERRARGEPLRPAARRTLGRTAPPETLHERVEPVGAEDGDQQRP